MNKELSNKIYIVTTILSVFVVFIHSTFLSKLDPVSSFYSQSYIAHRFFLVLCDCAVPTFFAISAFLLFRNYSIGNYPHLLLKKIKTLVFPYFLWSVIGFLFLKIFIPILVGNQINISFPDVLLELLMADYCPPIWFIRPLFVYMVASPLLFFCYKYLKKWSLVIPVAIFIVFIFFRPAYSGYLFFIPAFFVGGFLSYFKINICNTFKPFLVAAGSLLLMLLFSFLISYFCVEETSWIYFCFRFASVPLIWLAIDLFYKIYDKNLFVNILSQSSFVFFTHYFVIYILKLFVEHFSLANSNASRVVCFFAVGIIASSICIGVGFLLKHFVNPIYRFFTGGR